MNFLKNETLKYLGLGSHRIYSATKSNVQKLYRELLIKARRRNSIKFVACAYRHRKQGYPQSSIPDGNSGNHNFHEC